MNSITLPRNAHAGKKHALHVFCDASKRTFGVVAYVVSEDGTVQFLSSRARVAPKSQVSKEENLTVPRLELTALLFGCRFAKYLTSIRDRPYSDIYIWSDAKVALAWVESQTSTSTYVVNRAREIKDLAYEYYYNIQYVSTNENPADIASKGCSAAFLKSSSLWKNGPSWLSNYNGPETSPLVALMLACPARVHQPYPCANFSRFKTLDQACEAYGR